ncbi:hypothetical protein ACLEPN_04255 [Myxococcus sp. 1LA]
MGFVAGRAVFFSDLALVLAWACFVAGFFFFAPERGVFAAAFREGSCADV